MLLHLHDLRVVLKEKINSLLVEKTEIISVGRYFKKVDLTWFEVELSNSWSSFIQKGLPREK